MWTVFKFLFCCYHWIKFVQVLSLLAIPVWVRVEWEWQHAYSEFKTNRRNAGAERVSPTTFVQSFIQIRPVVSEIKGDNRQTHNSQTVKISYPSMFRLCIKSETKKSKTNSKSCRLHAYLPNGKTMLFRLLMPSECRPLVVTWTPCRKNSLRLPLRARFADHPSTIRLELCSHWKSTSHRSWKVFDCPSPSSSAVAAEVVQTRSGKGSLVSVDSSHWLVSVDSFHLFSTFLLIFFPFCFPFFALVGLQHPQLLAFASPFFAQMKQANDMQLRHVQQQPIHACRTNRVRTCGSVAGVDWFTVTVTHACLLKIAIGGHRGYPRRIILYAIACSP